MKKGLFSENSRMKEKSFAVSGRVLSVLLMYCSRPLIPLLHLPPGF